jgi:hypothetical protein
MKINEIMNSTAILKWQTNGRFLLAAFEEDNKTFIIQLERRQLVQIPELKKLRTAEGSFYQDNIKDIDKAFGTTKNASKIPVAVYGKVSNGFIEKLPEFDALYFIAAKKHSEDESDYASKKRIYAFIADKIVKSTSKLFYYEAENNYEAEFLISKVQLSEETKKSLGFKNPLSEAIVNLNFGAGFY